MIASDSISMNQKSVIPFSMRTIYPGGYGMHRMKIRIFHERFMTSVSAIQFHSHFFKNLNTVISVKDAGCNGNIRGLGNKNRLYLTIFVQQTILAFHHMDESKQSKRPLDWIQRVDAMLLHFRGDHSACDCLERSVIALSI